jgi:hypothetical protein
MQAPQLSQCVRCEIAVYLFSCREWLFLVKLQVAFRTKPQNQLTLPRGRKDPLRSRNAKRSE